MLSEIMRRQRPVLATEIRIGDMFYGGWGHDMNDFDFWQIRHIGKDEKGRFCLSGAGIIQNIKPYSYVSIIPKEEWLAYLIEIAVQGKHFPNEQEARCWLEQGILSPNATAIQRGLYAVKHNLA